MIIGILIAWQVKDFALLPVTVKGKKPRKGDYEYRQAEVMEVD
jgi:hypothetical protein